MFGYSPIWILVLSVSVVVVLILRLKINAFLALVVAAMTVGLLSDEMSVGKVLPAVTAAFGTLAGRIGIVIALAALIGQCLMESGAADRITRRFVALLGERRASLSLLTSGFVLSVPVFFDTVFYLLVPLARAMRIRTGRNYLLFVMSICAGAAVTHTMVPPTPGPLTVSETLKLDLGLVIMAGIVLGLPMAAAGWIFSRLMDRVLPVELRETSGPSLAELQELAGRSDKQLPGFGISILPIVLPVLLITSNTVVGVLWKGSSLANVTSWAGHPAFALMLSAAIAMAMLARQKGYGLAQLADALQPALANGGLIILITAAGGAYGQMLVEAKVGDALADIARTLGIPVLLLSFLLSALLKIAQGSSTVAMITASSIVAPLLLAAPPAYHPVYVGAAIASGSLVGSWMNDSGFWVYKQMSGLTELEALKTWTPLLVVLGVTGFLGALLGSTLLPLR